MNIYEKQTNEHVKSYELFKLYLNLGSGRSLGQLINETKMDYRKIYYLAKKWKWESRANQFDFENLNKIDNDSNKKINLSHETSDNSMFYINAVIKKYIYHISRKLSNGEEQFDKLTIIQMVDGLHRLIKLVNEHHKLPQRNHIVKENHENEYLSNIAEKINNNPFLFDKTEEYLSLLAGE